MRDPQKLLRTTTRSALEMLRGMSRKAIVTLLLCIGLGIIGIYLATTVNSDIPLSSSGSWALIFGVIVTLLIGMGLMALIFFSSRSGFDQPPELQSDNSPKKSGYSTSSDEEQRPAP
jgi:hypothetical protein